MNNIFDIKRFGNYFLYDLRRAKNNFGLSLLIMGLIPVILYVVYLLLSLLSGKGVNLMPDAMKFAGVLAVLFVVIFGAGAKMYGFVTEKRAGSDFLMLPASTTEKWLSLVLMVCIVLPVVFFVLLLLSDGLMSLIFPNTYGNRLLDPGFTRDMLSGMLDEDGVGLNLPALLFCSWCENILAFTLGALCFKRAKVAKTLLCLFVFGMVLSTLLVITSGTSHIDTDRLMTFFDNPDTALSFVNWTINIIYALIIGGLLWGTWYRLRTIKH
ncbi:MAG: hypothetical protein J6O51_10580 [Bacteroidales bacterium]|nr:hypothetical protein [Bacteroidales bacterium]